MQRDVHFMDLAASRMFLNFLIAIIIAYFSGKRVYKDVPADNRCILTTRSIMLFLDQLLCLYALSLLSLGIVTILHDT